MSRKPILSPKPRHVNRPLANGKSKKARTSALMTRVEKIMAQRGITTAVVAIEIGANKNQVSEWVNGNRSAPNSEWTLALDEWCDRHKSK